VSAINRNFPGRSGPGEVYLASPQVVAASALKGEIITPEKLFESTGLFTQAEKSKAHINAGAKKVVIGSNACPEFLEGLCEAIGRERVVVALDSFKGEVVVNGWQEGTGEMVAGKMDNNYESISKR